MVDSSRPLSLSLAALEGELAATTAHAHRLVDPPDPERWARRPEPAAWSAGECIEHLNATSLEFLPRIRDALERRATVPRQAGRHYRCDPLGGLLAWLMEPPVRFPTRTPPPFQPAGSAAQEQVMAVFDHLQRQLGECLHEADGLPLGRVWIRSPFVRGLRYNLFSSFRILAAHQRRHLVQAERAVAAVSASSTSATAPGVSR